MTESNEESQVVQISINTSTPLILIEEYGEFKIPMIECPPFELPWEEWPSWPPPPTWEYAEPFDALLECCFAHKLPPDVDLSYGPPYRWITAKPKPQPPKEEIPVQEYLEGEKVHDLLLEAMKLIVIERPERPVEFVALYLREWNPKVCKVNCRRHCHLGDSCHCKILPPPPPPPKVEEKPKKKKGEGEEEEGEEEDTK